MNSHKKRIVLWSAFGVCAFLLLGMLVPLVGTHSNCGGNSAAQAQCRLIAIRVGLEVGEGAFQPQDWSQYGRTEVARLSLKHWTPKATYYVRTNLTTRAADKTVVAVCDTHYENVPQATIWNLYRKNPAHAVAYLDGSIGLLTLGEFSNLDLANFTDAATLALGLACAQPTNQ